MDTYVIQSAKDAKPKKINIVNCLPDNVFVEPGQSTPESAKSAIRSLECAVEDIKNGDIDVLVTAPINKKAMVAEGFGNTGHTEYLQKEFGVDERFASYARHGMSIYLGRDGQELCIGGIVCELCRSISQQNILIVPALDHLPFLFSVLLFCIAAHTGYFDAHRTFPSNGFKCFLLNYRITEAKKHPSQSARNFMAIDCRTQKEGALAFAPAFL